MVIFIGNEPSDPISNTQQVFTFQIAMMPLGKVMNPTILSSNGWIIEQTGLFVLGMVTSIKEGKLKQYKSAVFD